MRAAIRQEIATIRPLDALEASHQEDALAFHEYDMPLHRADPHLGRFLRKLSVLDAGKKNGEAHRVSPP